MVPEVVFHYGDGISQVTSHLEGLPWALQNLFSFLLRPSESTGRLPCGPHWFHSLFLLDPSVL